jgi:hypothetical protein
MTWIKFPYSKMDALAPTPWSGAPSPEDYRKAKPLSPAVIDAIMDTPFHGTHHCEHSYDVEPAELPAIIHHNRDTILSRMNQYDEYYAP